MKKYPPRVEPRETPVLGYEGSRGRRRRHFDDRSANAVVLSAVGGMLITISALVLAVLSSGAGHGDYGFARLLFPIPLCVAVFVTGSIDTPSIVLALVQFSIYGGLIGYYATSRWCGAGGPVVGALRSIFGVFGVVGVFVNELIACRK